MNKILEFEFDLSLSEAPRRMCSSKNICVVLMKKLCNSTLYHLVGQGCKKVNSSKNDRFRYEMIRETQPEMEFLEAVAFSYPRSLKAGSSIHL